MDYEKRIDGEILLTDLRTPEIFRSYVMGRMLGTPFCEITDDKLCFSINDLRSIFGNSRKFKFLFPDDTQVTRQKERNGVNSSFGNDYERTRDEGPNRVPG